MTKIWLIIIALLVACGLAVSTVLNSDQFETNSYMVNAAFTSISIQTDTADISLAVSDDGKCRVVCYESEKVSHCVATEEDVLTVNVVDERKWYERIGIFMQSPKITVYLPVGEYHALTICEDTGDIDIPHEFRFVNIDISTSTGDIKNYASATESVKLKASTGNIHVEDISANALDLSVSTGKVTVTDVACAGDMRIKVTTGKVNAANVACNHILSDGDTGDMILENVIATEKISVERTTGDVKFAFCDAGEIFVKTDTGDVTGSLLTDKVFITETDTGKIHVPKSTTGGRCEISTDTGDIKISIS